MAGETKLVQKWLLYFFHKCMKQVGGEEAINGVIVMHSNTCCYNSIDPSDHFLPQIFPFCKQAPLKDAFHHTKGILDQTEGFSHPLHDAFRHVGHSLKVGKGK
jgi:hypothetical protein